VTAVSAGVEVDEVSKDFGSHRVLDRLSMTARPGEVQALLGPNGAGKTTLLRILCGLVDPGAGSVRIAGIDPTTDPTECRRRIGFVPSSDRSFYLRLSARENMLFFARLQGMRRRDAERRVTEVIDEVGLGDAARRRVGLFSHGMQKRLAVARALLTDPPVLLVDEATHDLDPVGAARVQELVRVAADRGAAVMWATQRLDEIRGFADGVTVLAQGVVRFAGSVPELMAIGTNRRYVLELTGARVRGTRRVMASFDGRVALRRASSSDRAQWLLDLDDGAVLGHVVAALQAEGVDVRACREQESGMQLAFLQLTESS
jgi:ABC-2 type transport system ATP-binding protein